MKAPRKITLTVRVKNGKFVSNTQTINEILLSYNDMLIDVTFTRRTNKRSLPQNNYYWGCIVPIFISNIKDSWGEIWSAEQVHEFLKDNCNYREVYNEENDIVVRTTVSTTENDTKQQEDFHEKCRQLSHQFFNTTIPLPEEKITIEFE